MEKLQRKAFLKLGALVILSPLTNSFWLQAASAKSSSSNFFTDDILKRLITANDKQVADLLQTINEGAIIFSRKIGYDFAALSAAYASNGSAYFHSPLVVAKLGLLTKALISQQSADGTVNIANLESPPDTAFLVELLSAATGILLKDNSADLREINSEIKKFLVKTGDALTTGGVHTPNHRWVICAALARLNALYPHKKYIVRIDDWLGEGIYIDADGHYPERSGLYAGVENNSLITMSRLLNKPMLLEPVRKNLEMTYYYIEPDGDLVTNDSRRQDQYVSKGVIPFYLHYRYMAIRDNNKKFAAIAKQIENSKGFEKEFLDKGLFYFLEDVLLQKELPAPITLSDNYEKLFTTSNLLRIRRGNTTTTLFGGIDWPLQIESGRSNSPNFFSYRKGNAILKYMRMSAGFFGMGYFYSKGINKVGNKYILQKKLAIPYYQPLPANWRNSKGDYKLSPSTDNRFWNKMDFKHRPLSNVKTLDTKIIFLENGNTNEVEFQVTGHAGVSVAIELCFLEGGKLSGVSNPENDNYFLEKGFGEYIYGGDFIRFGPGAMAHKKITELEGERYSTHFGSLRTEGMHVFITGTTPFMYKLTFS